MDSHQNMQFPPATAPIDEYAFGELAPLPNYTMQPMQQVMQSAAPVPSGNYFNQGAQYAPARAMPIAHYTGPVVQPNPWAQIGSSLSQRDPFAPPQATYPGWSIEQVVQPTAPVPYGNYHQGGLYTPGAISTPGMVARTPGTISPADIPAASTDWHMTYLQMPAAQMQVPQAHLGAGHQPQQQPAAPVQAGNHMCQIIGNTDDQAALIALCDYTRQKGLRGESCANVGGEARRRHISEYLAGDEAGAKSRFQRLASKNLNQAKIREAKRSEAQGLDRV
jgi:hypothetical protein